MIDKDEVREAIVAVSRNIFSKFGFRKTTMDDIADAARKGKSSIYYYFSSKEEVFKAVVEKEASLIKVELLKVTNGDEDPREKLKQYIIVRMKAFNNMANFYNAIKSDFLRHLEFIDTIRKKYDNEEVNMIENILKEGIDKNLFKVDNSLLAARAIVISMKGLEIPLFWENDEGDVEHRLDVLLDVLFNGIVKR
jgi:AcrR family transcriptional regulator